MDVERLYWIVAGIVFLYLIHRYRKSGLFVLIILFFFEGFFTYWGQLPWDLYKISLPVYALFLIQLNDRYIKLYKADKALLWAFFLFSVSFGLSSIINHDPLLLSLNQYSGFLLPVIVYLLAKAHYNRYQTFEWLIRLIWLLLNIQIGMTILNFLLMGVHEPIVGTISSNGGSAAAVLPVLGFIFLWLVRRGKLTRKDWVYVILLAFIGFVSNKRAIWLIMPLFIFLFTIYVPRLRLNPKYFIVILFIPLFFYLGVRLNPTLNREKQIWGSFDFEYFFNYAKGYTFGDDFSVRDEVYAADVVVGRGGATLYTLGSIFSLEEEKLIIGNGLLNMYAFGHNTAENPDSPIKIGSLNSITMATGIFQNYYTGGLIGVFLFLLFVYRLLSLVQNRRIRIVLILFFLWEYLLYAHSLMRTPATFSFLVLIILLCNQAGIIQKGSLTSKNAKT